MDFRRRIIELIGATSLLFGSFCCSQAFACNSPDFLEASGVIVDRELDLLIVGDESPGCIYKFAAPAWQASSGTSTTKQVTLHPVQWESIAGPLAQDLESIEITASGDIIVLSERLNSLIGVHGIVSEYPSKLTEIGGRGLEGISVRGDGKVAALWEGGYLEQRKLPTESGFSLDKPLNPILCVHDISATVSCDNGMVALKVPTPPGKNQAFRATDLVWDNEDTVIALLSSTNTDGGHPYGSKWLQKFSVDDGETVGVHLNLCAPGILPDNLRDGPSSNLEGLAWYQEGKKLVLVNDYDNGPATAVLIDVQSWPTVDDPTSCRKEDEPNKLR